MYLCKNPSFPLYKNNIGADNIPIPKYLRLLPISTKDIKNDIIAIHNICKFLSKRYRYMQYISIIPDIQ